MVPSCSGAYRRVHEVKEKLKTCYGTTLFCRNGRYEEKREADSDAGGDSERLGGPGRGSQIPECWWQLRIRCWCEVRFGDITMYPH